MIIPKELYHWVQEERHTDVDLLATKKVDVPPVKGKYSAKYVLSDIMVCTECGQPYRRQDGPSTV
ncbi:hypothetical protein LBYZC6_28670 [Lacrimispora brassicae]